MHVGHGRDRAADREQAQHEEVREQAEQVRRAVVHRRSFTHATAMAIDPSPTMTHTKGRWNHAVHTMVSAANARQMGMPIAFRFIVPSNFRPVEMMSPEATAPIPRSAPVTAA